MKIHKIARTSLALLAGLLLIVGLSGCEVAAQRAADEAERAVEDATGIRVDTPAPGEGGGAQLPEAWPAEAPVYPEATVTEAATTTMEGVTQHFVTFRTKDAHQDVASWFKSELEAKGWTINSEITTGSGQEISTTFIAIKDKLTATVYIYIVDGEVEISQQVLY